MVEFQTLLDHQQLIPTPKNVKTLQAFIEFANHYSVFIKMCIICRHH